MQPTRDVILDLLPLYQEGQASEDTRRFVEAYLKNDPMLARELERKPEAVFARHAVGGVPEDLEMRALNKTKKLLQQRSIFLAVAVFFSLLPFSVKFGSAGVAWVFADAPGTIAAFVGFALAGWAGYVHSWRRVRGTGL